MDSKKKKPGYAPKYLRQTVWSLYARGVNRFPRFIEYIQKRYIKIDGEPSLQHKAGGIENWNGNLGPCLQKKIGWLTAT